MEKERIQECIRDEAELFGVSPELINAVILQESNGFVEAFRYEKNFYWKYLAAKTKQQLGGFWPDSKSEAEEKTLRSCSFGLMQVMGQVAREFGFKAENLFDLYDPAKNIHFGTMKLARELERAKEKGEQAPIRYALNRYNGGGNPRYASEVLNRMKGKVQ